MFRPFYHEAASVSLNVTTYRKMGETFGNVNVSTTPLILEGNRAEHIRLVYEIQYFTSFYYGTKYKKR